MLERLEIRNFQAHSKIDIELSPLVTAIVGPSDVGKSSIIRALRWLALNEPQGDKYIRHGTPGATVALQCDGRTITRRRRPDGNTYHLDGQEYKAFGADVPQPVAKLLNVGPQNFQFQHDSPYWFSETAGEVSRQLNAVVDLGVIDDTLANINSTVARARDTEQQAATRLGRTKDAYNALAWAAAAAAALGAVAGLDAARLAVAAKLAALAGLIAAAKAARGKQAALMGAALAALNAAKAGRAANAKMEECTTLGTLINEVKQLMLVKAPAADEVERLGALHRVAIAAGLRLASLARLVADVQDAAEAAVLPDVGLLTKLRTTFETAALKANKKGVLAKLVSEARRAADTYGKAAAANNAGIRGLVKATEGRCPVCGGVLKL